jgi:hypothetical protein
MVPVIFSRARGGDETPRVNVVAMALLLASLAIGAAATVATGEPLPIIVMAVVGVT